MHRRNFLHSSSLLIPALIAVPSAIFASPQKTNIKVLVVQGVARRDVGLTASVKDAFKGAISELVCTNVKRLYYSGSEFIITTHDNRVITAEKIVLNTLYKIDGPANSIEIKTADTGFHIDYDKAAGGPEFWSFRSGHCSVEKLLPFVRRKGSAFLCVS